MKRFRTPLIGLVVGLLLGVVMWGNDKAVHPGYVALLRFSGDPYTLSILKADLLTYAVVGMLEALMIERFLRDTKLKPFALEVTLGGKILNIFARSFIFITMTVCVGILFCLGIVFTRSEIMFTQPQRGANIVHSPQQRMATLAMRLETYASAYHNTMPDMRNASTMYEALSLRPEDGSIFYGIDPTQALLPNPKTSYLRYYKIAPATVLIYDPAQGTDGRHLVLLASNSEVEMSDSELNAALAKSPTQRN